MKLQVMMILLSLLIPVYGWSMGAKAVVNSGLKSSMSSKQLIKEYAPALRKVHRLKAKSSFPIRFGVALIGGAGGIYLGSQIAPCCSKTPNSVLLVAGELGAVILAVGLGIRGYAHWKQRKALKSLKAHLQPLPNIDQFKLTNKLTGYIDDTTPLQKINEWNYRAKQSLPGASPQKPMTTVRLKPLLSKY